MRNSFKQSEERDKLTWKTFQEKRKNASIQSRKSINKYLMKEKDLFQQVNGLAKKRESQKPKNLKSLNENNISNANNLTLIYDAAWFINLFYNFKITFILTSRKV